MNQVFATLTPEAQLEFVKLRQSTRQRLYKPSRSRGKQATINDMAQILSVDKRALKKYLLTLPEFSAILDT